MTLLQHPFDADLTVFILARVSAFITSLPTRTSLLPSYHPANGTVDDTFLTPSWLPAIPPLKVALRSPCPQLTSSNEPMGRSRTGGKAKRKTKKTHQHYHLVFQPSPLISTSASPAGYRSKVQQPWPEQVLSSVDTLVLCSPLCRRTQQATASTIVTMSDWDWILILTCVLSISPPRLPHCSLIEVILQSGRMFVLFDFNFIVCHTAPIEQQSECDKITYGVSFQCH